MSKHHILQAGRNCWRICKADRFAFLIDGASYFTALHDSLPLAQRQVLVLSWDIYSRLHLLSPDNNDAGTRQPTLGTLLDRLVRKNPRLHVNILSWDFSLLFALSREWLPIYKLDWNTHRRLSFHLDDQHPLGSSHHQKVVVIDDSLAFAGGLDLTRGRWDTSAHDPGDPRRHAVDGEELPVRPYHDVQVAVSGPAAAALGDLARERWRRATNKRLPVPATDSGDLWPPGLSSDMENVDVAVVRTAPAYQDYREVREVEQLYLDAIAAAQDYIYIENQYFTAAAIGKALAKRLAEADGPEVILVLPLEVEGWLSQQSMDMMRVGLIRKLREADRYQRLAAYYPDKPELGNLSINVHAKLMIMDDRLVRVGSANLNNRSMGLDTECDLAVEAGHDAQRVRAAIRNFRNRLLAEHLGCTVEDVDKCVQQTGSVKRAINTLQTKARRLSPLEPHLPQPDERLLRDIRFSDPEHPVDGEAILNHFVPHQQARPAGQRVTGWLVSLLVLLGLAAAWRFTPLNQWLQVSSLTQHLTPWLHSELTPLIVIAAFVLGGLLVIPVTTLIIVVVLAFGPLTGFVYALIGSLLSAVTGYGLGNLLGRHTVRRLAGRRINQVSRQLARRGLLTMLIVRIVPVAPFSIINLVAGASHIRFRDFLWGTIFGMTPGILGITLLTDRVSASLRSPDWQSLLSLVLVALVVFVAGYLLAKRLLNSARHGQDAPANTNSDP